jgi:hypothetical protein
MVWLYRGDSICLAGCSIVDTAWCIQSIEQVLMDKRVMLRDYFSLEINDDGELVSIPLLLKGYSPSLGKLPTFLLRLGPNVSLFHCYYCCFILSFLRYILLCMFSCSKRRRQKCGVHRHRRSRGLSGASLCMNAIPSIWYRSSRLGQLAGY